MAKKLVQGAAATGSSELSIGTLEALRYGNRWQIDPDNAVKVTATTNLQSLTVPDGAATEYDLVLELPIEYGKQPVVIVAFNSGAHPTSNCDPYPSFAFYNGGRVVLGVSHNQDATKRMWFYNGGTSATDESDADGTLFPVQQMGSSGHLPDTINCIVGKKNSNSQSVWFCATDIKSVLLKAYINDEGNMVFKMQKYAATTSVTIPGGTEFWLFKSNMAVVNIE